MKKLRCDEAAEMMGVCILFSGNKQKNIKELKTEAVTLGLKTRVGNSSPEEAWIVFHTNISAKLKCL